MSLSIGAFSDDHGKPDARALGPSRPDTDMAAFIGGADARTEMPGATKRPFYSKLLDYSAHTAMIIGLLGFAWTVSDHVGKPSTPTATPATQTAQAASTTASMKAPAAPKDETAELRAATQKMAADIGALRLSLDSLRGSIRQDVAHQDKTAEQIRSLLANLDGVKSSLAATKTETTASLTQLSGKLDHLQHADTTAKMQQIADKLDKLERQAADLTPTASIAQASHTASATVSKATPKAAPVESEGKKPTPVKASLASAEPEPVKKPAVLTEWVVRDVYDGVAVVESKRGPMEVVPGVNIPGAGVVKSIERHGNGWTVTTSKGQIAYMPMPRDRSPRDFYRSVPDDF